MWVMISGQGLSDDECILFGTRESDKECKFFGARESNDDPSVDCWELVKMPRKVKMKAIERMVGIELIEAYVDKISMEVFIRGVTVCHISFEATTTVPYDMIFGRLENFFLSV
jgi:hypothetical protein